jgi:hypothetical protein
MLAEGRCTMPTRRAVKANVKTKVRRPLRFHQREAERIMRAVRKLGLPITSVNVAPDGSISIGTVNQTTTNQTTNPWEEDAQDQKRPA